MEVKWKAFNHCKQFGEESYMFIFTSEIGHLTSGYLCITWLNWLLKFILDYGLIHTWYPHTQNTSLMFNEYVFCVMCVCPIAWWSNPKRFFWLFYLFLEVFFVTLAFKVFLKISKILCWKTMLRLSSHEILKKFQFLRNFRQRVSRVPREWIVT